MKILPKERRQFFRHPIQVPIKLRVVQKNMSFQSASRDLSLGGLKFIWPRKLIKGTLLDISIPVKQKMFELRGKVVYSREDRKTARYATGILFVDFPSAFKARLAEEVLQIMEYRKTISRQIGQEVSEEEAASQWVRQYAADFPAAG